VINAPVLLADGGTIQVGSGGSWSPNLEKMQSLTRDHVVIEEMRVWVRTTSSVTKAGAGSKIWSLWPSAVLTCSVTAGRHALTNGYVGLSNLGASAERYGAAEFSRLVTANLADYVYNANTLRWRFPRPFAVAAGTPISPTFRYQTPDGRFVSAPIWASNSLVINVAFLGRTIDQMPRTTCVPFAADYTARDGQIDSHDTDLMNTCQRQLNVTGLGIGFATPLSWTNYPDAWALDQLLGATSWASGAAATAIKIYDQDQFSLVPQYTPIDQLGGGRMIIPTPGYVLPSRGYLRVNHQTAPSNLSGLASVTLNGWREEAVQ
jgi:hypothetical protein